MARFIVADLTEPSSIPKELEAIVPGLAVPVQPLLEGASRPYSMFRDGHFAARQQHDGASNHAHRDLGRRHGKAALVGRLEGDFAAQCRFFCERSARPRRRAVNLARGRCAPLAAVRPRLLRTGRGDRSRRRSGGLERAANGKPIALGSRRGGVCLGLGSDGSGRSGVGLYLGIGGERRHHGSADCKRGHASYEPKDGHLTTHPAAPVAPRTRSGVLGVSRGGETKGSRSKARFPAYFPVKTRHPGRPEANSAADRAQNGRNRRGRRGFGARAARVERPRNRSAVVEYVEKVSPVRPIRIEAALPPHT